MTLSLDAAETIGLHAVAWLAANDELFPVFMGSSGASEADVRANLQDPEFQASVLDFLLMDDAWVIGFCDAQNIPYESVMQARAVLPGGGQVHWT
ncbi:hypothetical protein TRP8649_03508 [Pelagimonas phthalicica]|uniref:DUF3572 domain-containing protein n=1 Tax=Pelagimonas phthalicica TaxID=1037362 RepID=A0A238JGQ0_9RHOB|nr:MULTISPECIES: DUF3572 domain-containing protein [Roseobacteraceae]MBO9468306.1 DUF3572 domain-containing protein [Tropicibacter sp. R15_0]TDS92313.1 uncharacterized protein DUF3572 [Pelagimonas phthalicica]SMX29374.1 hypothetical protein TRP8649_03508 [Pelagimonas phthalicica]